MPHPDLTTKNILLFGFKVTHINSADGISIWKNIVQNSPFSFRPIAILALPENEDNVKYLMNSLINEETALIEANGLKLSKGHANVRTVRSMFDTKMAQILSGAGGANCQLCTARFDQIHDIEFVLQGFPINRTIQDAKILFQEVEGEEFLSLRSDDRYNITHPPASDKDIVSASPLHAYLRCFACFFKLICHLVAGETDNWSSSSVSEIKKVIISFIKEKLNILIDAPTTQAVHLPQGM